MGTKANPGSYDCYTKAAADEPLFTLRAKDPIAPHLVRVWRHVRAGDPGQARAALDRALEVMDLAVDAGKKEYLPHHVDKSIEADLCANSMELWYHGHK